MTTTPIDYTVPVHYHLYINNFDDTFVIIVDNIKESFEQALTTLGCSPSFICSSYDLLDLQMKVVEYEVSNFNKKSN